MTDNKCKNCWHWRDKGWDAKGIGIGICDNPVVIKEVTTITEEMLERFVPEKSERRMIAQSMRFNSEFGCIHHDPVEK